MSDPAVSRDPIAMRDINREYASSKELLDKVTELESLIKEEKEIASLIDSGDDELVALATDDAEGIRKKIITLQGELEDLLIPRDPRDERDVIMEIRAGAGGEEAALFAAELFRAYSRYAESKRWSVHKVASSNSDQGGYKEVVAEISGKDVFGMLKFERGVHRVQRIPETEKQGRVHTSTITVAVLPQVEEVEFEIKTEDLRIDTYRASGAGGQHVNKTSSAIRITHIPTNTVVAVQDERSQHKNKEKAMRILRAKLLEAEELRRHETAAEERKKQVGTGDRSEKIRTYNFPQDRITDHRIKKNWSNIEGAMEGDMERIFLDLREAEKQIQMGSE